MRFYRDLLKHSSIYGLGQILGRLASILLLPLYTHYLRPADYGVIAILDLLAGLLAILIGSGMATAVTRYYFDERYTNRQSTVWWSGLTFVIAAATLLVFPAWLMRGQVADIAFGSAAADGATFFSLALMTVWFGCIGQLPETYLRVRKWSGLSVVLSLIKLLLNIGLNVYFLVVVGLRIEGILLGNLITSAVMSLVLCGIMAANERPFSTDGALLLKLVQFGSPLIVTAMLSTLMHEMDRYLLRLYAGMDEVGVYSLAYQIGQGVSTLCLLPFAAIWGVVVYEIAGQPNAKQVYATVFEHFVKGLALVMLGASLFARPILSVLTAADYQGAAELVPVICFAYLFFSLHEHFRVPVVLTKRTLSLVPVYFIATVVNIACNMALIPKWGASGAAWSSVITFAAFSGIGLLRYRRIERYPYPLLKCSAVVLGMLATYVAFQSLDHLSQAWLLTIAAVVWTAWAIGLFGRLGVRLAGDLLSRNPDADDDSEAAAAVDSSREPVSHHA